MFRILSILLLASLGASAQAPNLFLNLNGNQVMGGSALSGVVAISSPAPAYGAVVQLSAGPGVSLPPSVTIPAGMTSAPFDIATYATGASQSVRVAASYGNAQKVAYLQILATPPPAQAPTYQASSSRNQQPGWNAGAEATADLQAEESWNYAAPYTPYGVGYWGAYGGMRGYGGYGGYGGGYRGGGGRR